MIWLENVRICRCAKPLGKLILSDDFEIVARVPLAPVVLVTLWHLQQCGIVAPRRWDQSLSGLGLGLTHQIPTRQSVSLFGLGLGHTRSSVDEAYHTSDWGQDTPGLRRIIHISMAGVISMMSMISMIATVEADYRSGGRASKRIIVSNPNLLKHSNRDPWP